MQRSFAWILGGLCGLLIVPAASVANVIVYDDQSENGFNDGCSFSADPHEVDVANTLVVHSGANSIRLTPDDYNAVSWCAPATYSAATDFTGIDFWVNGGTTGGQNVDVVISLDPDVVASASLTSLNGGTPVPAGAWQHIQATFTTGVLAYSGNFDRISLQDESGGTQADIYFDDVMLTSTTPPPAQNYVFGDSFEPEYMFVPQYSNFDGSKGAGNSIKIYQRTAGTSNFTFLREAPLGTPSGAASPLHPNAVTFAPDGGLWVVDDANSMLWRYTLQSMLGDANPAPTTHAGPTGKGSLYDLAFFGDYAYVSSDSGILKYTTAAMSATPVVLSDPGATPVGLAFDTQGRLWICNYGTPGNLVRMSNLSTGAIDVTISGGNINNAEGLSFDEYGSLWVADNNEPTMYAYGSWQLGSSGSPTPVGQINLPTPAETRVGAHPSGYVGGIAFDRHGDLRASYEYNYTVQAYSLMATPHSGGGYQGYTSSALSPLTGATSDPGRGGLAFWPRPDTLHIK